MEVNEAQIDDEEETDDEDLQVILSTIDKGEDSEWKVSGFTGSCFKTLKMCMFVFFLSIIQTPRHFELLFSTAMIAMIIGLTMVWKV